jgi:Ser/Thr protein kinase RdoA (MazF antagonist)
MSFEGIIYEHSVLKRLADGNFPSPRLIPNKQGETCLEMEGRYYALFDFIPGFKYTDYFVCAGRKRLFLAEAGRTLSRYHQIIDGFVPAGRKLDGFMPDGQRRWRDQGWYLDGFAKYKALFEAKDGKSRLDQFFADNLGRLEQCYVDLNQRVGGYFSQLPKVVNHGDYGPHNLIFSDNRMVAVLDFECVHLHLRVTDVIIALQFFAGRKVGFDYKAAMIFLEAYSSLYPLMAEEIELIPDIFRLILLEGLIYRFRDYFDLGNLLKLRYAGMTVAWLDWTEENGNDLIRALLAFKSKVQRPYSIALPSAVLQEGPNLIVEDNHACSNDGRLSL